MKKVFVCNTPYQLLISVHMAKNMFPNDCVDVIISNHFAGAEKIVARINEGKAIFHQAFYVQSFEFSRRQGKYKATIIKRHVLYGVNVKKTMMEFMNIIDNIK